MNPIIVILRNGQRATVRDARPRHLPGLMDLFRDSLAAAGHPRDLNEDEVRMCRSEVRPHRGMTLVAEFKGQVVGIAIVRKSDISARRFAPWWITVLGVHSKFRRLGVGTSLMTTAMSEVKSALGVEKVGLRVRRKNIKARRLYKKLEFVVAENAKKNPKLVMVKNL